MCLIVYDILLYIVNFSVEIQIMFHQYLSFLTTLLLLTDKINLDGNG